MSVCSCRNHMGSEKQQHASPEAAVEWVICYGLKFTGRARIYRCPSGAGCWHVRTLGRVGLTLR